MTFEIGTDVMTPDGPGEVVFITKRGMPKMGYTVRLDKPVDGFDAVHYPHADVTLHEPPPVPGV
jgi:hypothetical protein